MNMEEVSEESSKSTNNNIEKMREPILHAWLVVVTCLCLRIVAQYYVTV